MPGTWGRRAAAITGLFLFALLPAACGRSAGTGGPAVRFDVAADPATLLPLFAHVDAGNVEAQLAHLCFEPFFDLDASGQPVPALLTEMPTVANGGISADGRTIVYQLRRDVRWSDGVPVTARDVIFTLHAILDPRNPVASREGYELIDRADVLDPYTVRFHLRRAWAPAVSTFFAYGVDPQFVLPEHVLAAQQPLERAAFNAAPTVGDGPFTFVSWRRGERIEYVANPRYWRGRPAVARVEVNIVPAPETNLTLLRTGQIDFNLVAPSQQMELFTTTAGLRYAYAPTALIVGLALNLAHPPLDDVRVRRALAQSIDRKGISTRVTIGRYPVAESDRPYFSWAYDPDVAEPRYDPGAADAGFDAAGWRRGQGGVRSRHGQVLALTYVQFPETTTGVRTAELIQRELAERGVDVTIKQISNTQLFLPAREGGALALGRFDLAYVPWTMGADPDDQFLLGCNGDSNHMHYCNSQVDALEKKAASEPDTTKRAAMYEAIDRIVAGDVPIVYLFNPVYIYAYTARLQGFVPNGFVPTWNAYDWRIK